MGTEVSVVLCTRNQSAHLRRALATLAGQRGVAAWELVVVDNGSTDDTEQVLCAARDTLGDRLTVIYEGVPGLSRARNRGIAAATGEVVAFTDDDVQPRWDWLAQVRDALRDCDAIGGRVLPAVRLPRWWWDRRRVLDGVLALHDHGPDTFPYPGSGLPPFIGANMAMRAGVLADLGGFREDLGLGSGALGEDTEYFRRLLAAGCRVRYAGQAVVWHHISLARLRPRYVADWYGRKLRQLIRERGSGASAVASVVRDAVPHAAEAALPRRGYTRPATDPRPA